MSKGLLVKIAAFIVGLALPLCIAAPASASVTASRTLDDYIAELTADPAALQERFGQVETGLVEELDAQLSELHSFGLSTHDLDALAAGETVNGVHPSLLDGLLDTILNLVFELLASLGLLDALPLPDVPLPDLPTVADQQGLIGGLGLGGLLDSLLGLVQGLLASLGLIELPELPDLPVPIPGEGLPDTSALTELLNTILQIVMDLLASLGLIELPELPIPDLPVPASATPADTAVYTQ